MAKDYRLEKRKFVIGGIALSIVLIYLIRLFVLQRQPRTSTFDGFVRYRSRRAFDVERIVVRICEEVGKSAT